LGHRNGLSLGGVSSGPRDLHAGHGVDLGTCCGFDGIEPALKSLDFVGFQKMMNFKKMIR
jgi:hypothetical protein